MTIQISNDFSYRKLFGFVMPSIFMMVVTHDMRYAEALCDRAVLIEGGVVKEQGGKELAHRYFFEKT